MDAGSITANLNSASASIQSVAGTTDLTTSMRNTLEGGNPGVKYALGVDALQKSKIFDAEIAVILAVAFEQYSQSVFVDFEA